jgi:large subunit ribosomal protein L23
MAIFSKKTNQEEDKKVVEDKKTTKASSKKEEKKVSEKTEKKPFHVAKRKGRRQTAKQNMALSLERVLVRPRITEKATDVTANRTYVFEIATDANKRDVVRAVEHYYKVTPIKVNVVKIPSKKRRNRNRRTFGHSPVGKKAYVFLKEGDSIEFV